MRHFSHAFTDAEHFAAWLSAPPLVQAVQGACAVLVQVYAAAIENPALGVIIEQLRGALPGASIVGASTVGELVDGRTVTDGIVVGLSAFESTTIDVVALPVPPGNEAAVAVEAARRVLASGSDVRAALLLATPLSIDAAVLVGALGEAMPGVPVFGGGAGDYAMHRRSAVFTDAGQNASGLVLVAFRGDALRIEAQSYLGWRPLSREMTITESVGLEVRRLDGEPAFDIYRRYLGIDDPARFFLDALEFPLLLSRQGRELARVPVAVTEGGGLQFVADVAEGERVRLGYGDPASIIGDAAAVCEALRAFEPEAIFLYSCGCRRFLMQEDVEQETRPFQAIAPTFGFYTYGEFLGRDADIDLLNSTMVVVGFSERPLQRRTDAVSAPAASRDVPTQGDEPGDPYANQHVRIVGRLVHFIGSVSAELEAANREVLRLSRIDSLTGLLNRSGLDVALASEFGRQSRHREGFALVIIDIDRFKRINDGYGHVEGDRALVHVASVLSAGRRPYDIVGRWGGEEFLLLLPHVSAENAQAIAETLRRRLEGSPLPPVGRITASFGVAAWRDGDDAESLMARADAALYVAKREGRNRVQVAAG